MLSLDLLIDDAIKRIRRAYEDSDGKMYLSFSGGKDSTIVAKLVELSELPEKIPYVFADTGMELKATLDFVHNFDYENMVTVKPVKPMGKVLKEDGYPVISKERSMNLRTWQNTVEKGIDVLDSKTCVTILGLNNHKSNSVLAHKHMHLIHEDHEYKFSDKCCENLKKSPFYKYEIESGNYTSLLGIRLSEGGVRSKKYDSCHISRNKGNHTQELFFPILEWSDKDCNEFVRRYNLKLSRAYTVYGFTRTGCSGCVYSQELQTTLPVLRKYEPLRYKACMFHFKDIYVAQNIILRDDEEYMKYYEERRPVFEKRRDEMMEKYRPHLKGRKYNK